MRKGRESKPRPDRYLHPTRSSLPTLSAWIEPQVPPEFIQPHERASEADLLALAVSHFLHKVPYFNRWWNMLCEER